MARYYTGQSPTCARNRSNLYLLLVRCLSQPEFGSRIGEHLTACTCAASLQRLHVLMCALTETLAQIQYFA